MNYAESILWHNVELKDVILTKRNNFCNAAKDEIRNRYRTFLEEGGDGRHMSTFDTIGFFVFGNSEDGSISAKIQEEQHQEKYTEMMYMHQLYNGIIEKQQYTLRGSKLSCSYGTDYSLLDTVQDHGIYKGNLPVLTTIDCGKSNICDFGSCLCPESNYAGRLPMTVGSKNGKTAKKVSYNNFAHICVPVVPEGSVWQQVDHSIMAKTCAKGYLPLLLDSAALVCQYGGIIKIVEVPQAGTTQSSGVVYAIAEATSSSTFYNYMTQDKQEANALYIYYYLDKNESWTKEAIAGLLGNIQHESVMNPGAWQSMGTSGNGNINQGYGLVQWTAAQDKFLKYAGLSNIQANSLALNDPKALMDLQLEYILTTMKPGGGEWLPYEVYVGKHYAAYPLDSSTPRLMSYNDYISSAIDSRELALVFHATYERSGDYQVEQTEHRIQKRCNYAKDWYDFLLNY